MLTRITDRKIPCVYTCLSNNKKIDNLALIIRPYNCLRPTTSLSPALSLRFYGNHFSHLQIPAITPLNSTRYSGNLTRFFSYKVTFSY